MTSRTKDMTQGNPTRLILLFSLPLLAGTVLQQLYNLVDTLVIGRGEGVTALAAVSSTGWLDWTLLGLILGLAQGFAIQVAQSFGAGDFEDLRRSVGQSLTLSVIVVIVLEIIAQALLRPVLTLMNTPPDTYGLTLVCQAQQALKFMLKNLPLVVEDKSVMAPKIELSQYLIYIKPGEEIDFQQYLVKAQDRTENDITKDVRIETNADFKIPGTYSVHYYVSDSNDISGHTILNVIVG